MQMLIKRIIDEIKDGEGSHILRKDVLKLLNVATEGCAIEVASIRRGDVFWHKLVGGKIRPWVALSCREGLVVAASLSNSAADVGIPRPVKADCRFWGGYICTTVSLFHEDEVRKYVAHPYTNLDHLREVEAHIASLLTLRTLPGGKRNLDVPDAKETRQIRRAAKRKAVLERKANPPRAAENVLDMNSQA